MKFCKINVGSDKKILNAYKVKKLPSLLFFKNGVLLGKIEGYYDLNHKVDLKAKIEAIIKK
jgi:antitoxin component YwqK of YwqJK toxin-antitoxin module